jgi:hypothetical protein
MKIATYHATAVTALLMSIGCAHAAGYEQTIALFQSAAQSAGFFNDSYPYAVFPTVGKGSPDLHIALMNGPPTAIRPAR